MTTAAMSVTINRPVDDVFRVLTTPEDTPKWSSSAVEEQLTSPGPVGVGSTRRAVVRSFGGRTTTNEAIVTVFEPNRRVAMRTISAPVPFEAAWSFTALPDGTPSTGPGPSTSRALPGCSDLRSPSTSSAVSRATWPG